MKAHQNYHNKAGQTKQGSNGIRQWPIKRCTFPMLIHKITPSVDNRYWLKRLDTQLKETTNQKSLKFLSEKETLL